MSLSPRTVEFDVMWTPLLGTVKKVVVGESVPRDSWSDRFLDVYQLCVSHPEPHLDKLYDSTRTFLEEHVAGKLEVSCNHRLL